MDVHILHASNVHALLSLFISPKNFGRDLSEPKRKSRKLVFVFVVFVFRWRDNQSIFFSKRSNSKFWFRFGTDLGFLPTIVKLGFD